MMETLIAAAIQQHIPAAASLSRLHEYVCKRLVSNFIARAKSLIQNRSGAGPLRRMWAV